MLLMTPKLIQQGVYTEYFSSLLAQKLISPKDERSVGFSDGTSPSTRVSYYKHINLWCFCWCFFLLLHWMSCYNAKSCCDNRQDCLTFIYLQLKQSQIKRKTYRSYKLIILCCIKETLVAGCGWCLRLRLSTVPLPYRAAGSVQTDWTCPDSVPLCSELCSNCSPRVANSTSPPCCLGQREQALVDFSKSPALARVNEWLL